MNKTEEIGKILPDSVRIKLNDLCEANSNASPRIMIEIGFLAGINEGEQWWETAFESCNNERKEYRDKMDSCYAEYQSLLRAYNGTEQMDLINRLREALSGVMTRINNMPSGIKLLPILNNEEIETVNNLLNEKTTKRP
jgi:hypothetical protein